MKNYPLPIKTLLDFSWGMGVFILLLQLATVFMPASETRDWIYYFLTGGWAALFIAVGMAGRFYPIPANRVIRFGKIAFAIYAVAALSYYGIAPLFGWLFLWVWGIALMVTLEWGKLVPPGNLPRRIIYGAGMMWFLLCSFSFCGSLLYRSLWFGLLTNGDGLKYALPYIVSLAFFCPAVYAALRKPVFYHPRFAWGFGVTIVLHLFAIYCLIVPLFRTDGLNYAVSFHHWKAFLEPAASVRAGGWLLWDVPAQYGFLLTLIIAWLPAASVWQSFYLLNGALLTLSGYFVFYVLFAKYRSPAGYGFSLFIAVSCAAQLLPFIDSRLMPSTGAMRFFWIYPMVGYVYFLCRRFRQAKKLPRFSQGGGNVLWLAGALWSLESAIFVTLIWIPSMLLLAAAEMLSMQEKARLRTIVKRCAIRFFHLLCLILVFALSISLWYFVRLGHVPDVSLFMAYSTAYTAGFYAFPILNLGIISCWLYVFCLMVLTAGYYVAHTPQNAQNVLNFAVFYAAIVSLWAMASVYIPISDEVHLAGMLPALVYLSAIVLLLMPMLELPVVIKAACEKGIMCFYCIIILGTVNCFKPGLYKADTWLSPIHHDVTAVFPAPPQSLAELVGKAGVPQYAYVTMLAEPFTLEEGAYFHGLQFRPWLLPGTTVGYKEPLSPGLYQLLAERRAERMPGSYGWIIERKDNPLENYPWIKNAVEKYYKEISRTENTEYRIRKYEKLVAEPAS